MRVCQTTWMTKQPSAADYDDGNAAAAVAAAAASASATVTLFDWIMDIKFARGVIIKCFGESPKRTYNTTR